MKKCLLILFAFVCLVGWSAAAQVPPSRHVWVIAEENHSFEDAAASMPYLMSLGGQYGIATQYYADMHNSISALMHLTAGATVTTDDSTPDTFKVDNIVRHLAQKGLTFRSYQEQLPQPGFLGLWSGPYVKRHNPLAYFSEVANSNLRFNLVPLPQLASDLAHHFAANYNYVTPDLNHDAHDGSLQTADEWLQHYLPPILAQPEFQTGGDGLLFITFDEGNLGDVDFRCNAGTTAQNCGGRVLTVVVGPNVKRGFQSSAFYNHESLLATVCHALGTDGCPGKADHARPMDDFFIPPLSASPATATVASGEPAQYSLALQPVSGFFNADVRFSCGNLPAGAECYFSPRTVRPGDSGASTTLTVSLAPQSAAMRPVSRPALPFALWLGLPGLALIPAGNRKRKLLLALLSVAAAFLVCVGCGGGPSPALAHSSWARSYTINVTAQSSSASYSVPVTLHVTR